MKVFGLLVVISVSALLAGCSEESSATETTSSVAPKATTTTSSPPVSSTTVAVQQTTTTEMSTTTTTAYVGSIKAEFNGEVCTSEGPAQFKVGKRLHWILENTSDASSASYGLSKVVDGTTLDDLTAEGLDAFAEEPTYRSEVWAADDVSIADVAGPGEGLSWPIPLDAVGTWAVVCFSDGAEFPAIVIEVTAS